MMEEYLTATREALSQWLSDGLGHCSVHQAWMHTPLDPFTVDLLLQAQMIWRGVLNNFCGS